MTMEKRNVVEEKRTPEPELARSDDNWDKDAAHMMVIGNMIAASKEHTDNVLKQRDSKPEDK